MPCQKSGSWFDSPTSGHLSLSSVALYHVAQTAFIPQLATFPLPYPATLKRRTPPHGFDSSLAKPNPELPRSIPSSRCCTRSPSHNRPPARWRCLSYLMPLMPSRHFSHVRPLLLSHIRPPGPRPARIPSPFRGFQKPPSGQDASHADVGRSPLPPSADPHPIEGHLSPFAAAAASHARPPALPSPATCHPTGSHPVSHRRPPEAPLHGFALPDL